MPEFLVNYEVYCGKCGAGLCKQSRTDQPFQNSWPAVRVDPCERCLEEARKEGHEAGYDKGYSEAQEEAAA